MCEIAGVSRSGFYKWLNNAPNREAREVKDYQDFLNILEAYNYKGYPKGIRQIQMRLVRMGIRMSLKRIGFLMRKFGLFCPIRRPKPRYRIAEKESRIAPNIVNRNFTGRGPRKVLLTDITYIDYPGGRCYLSTILDAATREALAHQESESLEVEFVLDTVSELIEKYGAQLDDETIVHSDQGVHYTSKKFVECLKDGSLIQSMSRKGNCWDNAPQESFFGHMKDEIGFKVEKAKGFGWVSQIIDDYIDYYNNERGQWQLKKLAPSEYFEYLTTGTHPLLVKMGLE